jgi:Protein of unknown function, DUF481
LKKARFLISFVLFTALCSGQLFPQDTSAVISKDRVKIYWSGYFKVAGLYLKGNTDKIFSVTGAEIKRTDRIIETILSATLDYGESDGIKDENDLYSSAAVDLFYDRMFSPFVLQLAEFGYSREIDLRSQTGAGLKYTFVEIPEFKASISAAGIYDYTNLSDEPGNTDSRTWRLSARFKFKSVLFDGRISISHVTFYQPSFKDFTNAIWRSESELSMPLTSFLNINAAYLYKHEDAVPSGVKKSDHKLTFGLEVEFK